MTRIWHDGGEFGSLHASSLLLQAGVDPTFDTVTKRTGARSYNFSTSVAQYVSLVYTGATLRDYFAVGHFRIPAASGLPGTSAKILSIGGGSSGFCARLTTAGKIQLLNSATQIGSDSAATIVPDTWYRIEMKSNWGVGAIDQVELRLDGATVASSASASNSDAAPGQFSFGWIDDPGTSETINWDDLAFNDGQGSVNNTWVGDQEIYTSFPKADSARVNWTAGGAGTTNLYDAVNNTPPVGVLPAAGVAATAQIQNAVATAGSAYDATMQTYTEIGIGAADTITAIIPVLEIGSSSTTGADTLTHSVVSNPAIAGTAGSCDIVSGAYPTSWNRSQGVVSENPTVVKGTSPVMRIAKDIAIARINACCLMALSVAVSPAGAGGFSQPYRSVIMVGD